MEVQFTGIAHWSTFFCKSIRARGRYMYILLQHKLEVARLIYKHLLLPS